MLKTAVLLNICMETVIPEVTFSHFYASLLNKNINYFQKKKKRNLTNPKHSNSSVKAHSCELLLICYLAKTIRSFSDGLSTNTSAKVRAKEPLT